MRPRLPTGALFIAALACVVAAAIAWSVSQHRSEAAREQEPASAAPRVSSRDGVPVITLDSAAQHDAGIATDTLARRPFQQEVRAYGVVLDLEPLTALANRYDNAKAQLAIARAKLAASRAADERDQKLFRNGQNISAAQAQAAEAAFRVDEAGVAAAQSLLATIAATALQGWGPVLGQAIAEDGPLVKALIGGRQVLVQATLRPGQTLTPPPHAAVRRDSGGRVMLDFVSPATRTDPRLQGLSFLYTAPANADLVPGMTVVVLLPAGPRTEGVAVPAAAIVWEDGKAWAYFRTGPKSFARRPVDTGVPLPDGGYLQRHLAAGSQVVVAGAQMLLSEEFRAQTRAAAQGDQD
jgi:hypothetical protein